MSLTCAASLPCTCTAIVWFTEGLTMYPEQPLFTDRIDCCALPPTPAGKLFLHKLFFRRYLSHLLIATLLLLTPITFSNDNIPNFQPECETRSAVRITMRSAVAIFRSSGVTTLQKIKTAHSPRYSFPTPLFPAILQLSLATPSRAPPV